MFYENLTSNYFWEVDFSGTSCKMPRVAPTHLHVGQDDHREVEACDGVGTGHGVEEGEEVGRGEEDVPQADLGEGQLTPRPRIHMVMVPTFSMVARALANRSGSTLAKEAPYTVISLRAGCSRMAWGGGAGVPYGQGYGTPEPGPSPAAARRSPRAPPCHVRSPSAPSPRRACAAPGPGPPAPC